MNKNTKEFAQFILFLILTYCVFEFTEQSSTKRYKEIHSNKFHGKIKKIERGGGFLSITLFDKKELSFSFDNSSEMDTFLVTVKIGHYFDKKANQYLVSTCTDSMMKINVREWRIQ